MKTIAALSILICATISAPAVAQQDVCYRKSPISREVFFDEEATKVWQAMLARQDNALMARMAGVWYGEIPDPSGSGMVSYQYKSYQANGIWDYQSSTCSPGFPTCAQNQGTGFWTAQPASDGSISMFVIVSDLNVDHQCSGGYARMLDANNLQDALGIVWRRVR